MAEPTHDLGLAFRKIRARLNARLAKACAEGRLEEVITRLERGAHERGRKFDAAFRARKDAGRPRRPPSNRKPRKS